MRKYILAVLLFFCGITTIYADGLFGIPDIKIDTPDFVSANDIRRGATDDTKCATKVFADALSRSANTVSESSHETDIQKWAYANFYNPDVLKRVLKCPEIANAADDETIKFIPIEYTFPGGRKIVINYEAQPKVLKQRLMASSKRTLPNDNPDIMNDSGNVWTNVEPAWYAIMVVQSGTLSDFVGADKNNTISLEYIKNNIDALYPRGACTSKTALARDSKVMNVAATRTVGIEKDTNDYYVAGDKNLQWISYAEIALDVVITVVTFGAGAAASGVAKAARASRTSKTLIKSWKELRATDKVKNYVEMVAKNKRLLNEMKQTDRIKDGAKYRKLSEESKQIEKQISEMEKYDDAVKQYRDVSNSIGELHEYTKGFRKMRVAQTGNVVARTFRAFRAAGKSQDVLNKAARVARSSMKSGRVKDWLFQSTMKNAAKLATLEKNGGLIYGLLKFGGDMYDYTSATTDEFTNGIVFAPLLLLSADDIAGQENVVNYGMWLLWSGDSSSAADDDAAYLQAMDFATKLHQDLIEVMDEKNSNDCDVDLYVVRPIVRNPDSDDASLYYLIMNDEPWSTHD